MWEDVVTGHRSGRLLCGSRDPRGTAPQSCKKGARSRLSGTAHMIVPELEASHVTCLDEGASE